MKNKKFKLAKIDIFLLIILAISAIVRYWGINFGLPNTNCRPDEDKIVGIIVTHIKFFRITGFTFPSLYKYIILFLYGLYFLFGAITGRFSSITDFIREYAVNPTNFYLIDRSASAFFGAATVYIVYIIAKRLWDRETALVSSLYMSLAYLHVRDSHFGVTDITMTFFIMYSMLFIIQSYENKTLRSYVIAGIFAGLAASTKYAGILLIAPMGLVHFFNILDSRDKKNKLFFDKRILFFILALICVFLLGTPAFLVHMPKYIDSFLYEMRKIYRIEDGAGIGWWRYLRFALFFGMGWPLLLSSLIGIFALIKMNLRKALILCSFPLIYYIISGKGHGLILRYTIPVIPFLCVTAALSTVFVSNILTRYFRQNLKHIMTFSLAILIVHLSLYNVIQFDKLLTKKDSRLIAAEWVYENLPKGSAIYQAGSIYGQVKLNPTLESLEKRYREIVDKGYSGRVLKSMIDYYNKVETSTYEHWNYDEKRGKFEFEGNVKHDLCRYIIVQEHPLRLFTETPLQIRELLKTSYYLKKSFIAIDINDNKNLFDQLDAFYIPFVGFKDVKRPGPNIYIYEKKD